MKHLGPLVAALMVLASAGCAQKGDEAPRAAQGAAPALDGDDIVLEAVFRHELRNASAKPDDNVCLRVRPSSNQLGDASAALLTAIRRSYPHAVPGSACSGGGPTPVTVTASGKEAWICDIGPVKWDGDRAARVEGGGASRGGNSYIREVEYSLVKDGAAWRVAGEKVLRQN